MKSPRSVPGLLRTVAWVHGSVLVFVAVAMLVATAVSAAHREWDTARHLAISALITLGVGGLVRRMVNRPEKISVRQGFVTVGLAWFVFSGFGALPYLLSGVLPNVIDAFFETASGFTTTGATVVTAPENLPAGIVFWRALTQWLGGLGVVVLGVAVLPLLGTGGAQLTRAESSGLLSERLTPRFQGTLKRLWAVYAGLTISASLFLAAGEMDLFSGVVHALATVSTGGFGMASDSVASWGTYTKWVLTAFMLLGGVSFALHYRAIRNPIAYWRSSELKLYLSLTLGAAILMVGGLLADFSIGDAITEGTFATVSIITTTGFTSSDFALWRPALQILIVGIMFLGGMAGSTAGGIKTFRIGVLTKAAYSDLRRLVHPRGMFTTSFGKQKVADPVVEAVQSFFLFYMLIFMVSTFLLTFIDANMSEDLDLITSTSVVASALGNIGPALGDAGPAFNHAFLPGPAKLLLAGLMIVGRLELFPVLVLFTRDLWRR